MTITQVDSKQQTGSAGTRTVTLTTAPAAGDLLVAAIAHGGPKSAAVLAAPAGWTLALAHETTFATHGLSIYLRVATGTDSLAYTTGALTGSGNFLYVSAWRSSNGPWTPALIAAAVTAVAATPSAATELTATPAGPLPQASMLGIAAHHGGATAATLAYWDGDTIGHTPVVRASNGVADSQIETSIPATARVRVASWAAALAALGAIWIPEPIAETLPWPAGPVFVLDDLPAGATLKQFRAKIVEVHAALRTIIAELGVNPSGARYATVAQRIAAALPKIGGTVHADVAVPAVSIAADGAAALQPVRLSQARKAVPDSAINPATLALGDAWYYNATTGKVEVRPSPWRPNSTGPTPTAAATLSSFREYAPNNSRNVEHYCLYDTANPAPGTLNVPGGGFGVPTGNLLYVDPRLGNDTNPGTTLQPKRTMSSTTPGALGAVATIAAGSLQTTIILRGDPTGLTEVDVRESWPAAGPTSKVRGIQAEVGSRIWISGSDIAPAAQWSYVAGKGWEWNQAYNPQIVTADEMDSLLYTTTVAAGSPAVTVDAVVGQLPVANRSGFPQAGSFYVQVENERMLVTGGWGSGAGTFTVTRGAGGTTAAPHAVGVTVTNLAFRLTADITSASPTLTLNNKSNWPTAAGFRIKVDNEVMFVTTVTPAAGSSVTFGVTRGYSGTAPAAHTAGARIQNLTPDSDMLFVDGVPLIQSDTPNPGPGKFFVDRVAQRLYIGEAASWSITSHKIEVTQRAYVNGASNARNTKNGFFVRGLGFRHWGTDWRRDTFASLMFGGGPTGSGQDQLLEYCTFWHASTSHWDVSSTTRMIVREVVSCASGGPSAHANDATDLLVQNARIRYANWELGYSYTPGPTERTAGMKMADSLRPVFDNTLWMDNNCNGLWHDVHCREVRLYRCSFIGNLGYGYTQENGGTDFLAVDHLYYSNGNTTSFNKDAFRIAGVPHAHMWNVTSVDNYGAALHYTEYDWTFDTANLATPRGDGDTFDGLMRNCVGVITSRALTGVIGSYNGQPSPPGQSLPFGEARQTTPFSTEMMFSPDPFAADLQPQDDWNVLMRLNNASKPVGRWAVPTTDYTANGWDDWLNLTLAQIRTRGGTTVKCEAHSIGIDTPTSPAYPTDAALLTRYFPNRASYDFTWPGATIPGTAGAVVDGVSYPDGIPNLGDVPPDNVCDILGIPHGTRARFGCYNAPRPVPVGTGPAVARPFADASPFNTQIPATGVLYVDHPAIHTMPADWGGVRHAWVEHRYGPIQAQSTDPDWTIYGTAIDNWFFNRLIAQEAYVGKAPAVLPVRPNDDRLATIIQPDGTYVEFWTSGGNACAPLNANISATQTAVQVAKVEQFPTTVPFLLKLDDEVVQVTARPAGTGVKTLTVVRAQQGTTGARHMRPWDTSGPWAAPAWVSGTAYIINDHVLDGGILYRCQAGHTATSGNRPVSTGNAQWVRLFQAEPGAQMWHTDFVVVDPVNRVVRGANPASPFANNPIVWAKGDSVNGLGVGNAATRYYAGVRISNYSWLAGLISKDDIDRINASPDGAGCIPHALHIGLFAHNTNPWVSGTTYAVGDWVTYLDPATPHADRGFYRCKLAHTATSGNKPIPAGNAQWDADLGYHPAGACAGDGWRQNPADSSWWAVGKFGAPATAGNGGWPDGPFPLGTRFAIPRGTAPPAGLSKFGRAVFDALVNYGGFAGDGTGAPGLQFYIDGPSQGWEEGPHVDINTFALIEPFFAFWSYGGTADWEKMQPYVRIVWPTS